ncbi:MAG: hypothetical protein M1136_00585 [Chloroflexi bacterium]|nr:hypothetical protein [Chloroflexota bacterium]MCL5074137.1 hypothetical protein [Chloroflexota bacterium]
MRPRGEARPLFRRSLRYYAQVACVLVALVLLGNAIWRLPVSSYNSSPKVEPAPLRTIPDTDVNPYGANFFLHQEVEPWKVEKTLQMAKEAGIGWVKQQFPWEDIELQKGNFWDERSGKSTWEKYDRIVALAQKYGLKIIARLDRPPAWTRKDNTLREAPPDNFEDYGDFVYTVVKRYKGKISYYQLWNEPNIYPEWGNQPVDPAAYVRLLRIGYERAKQADPNVRILSAPLAQTLEQSPMNMSELTYLEKMYENGAKDYFDILFANAYGFSFPPDAPPDPHVLNFARVALLREIMVRHGDANKAIWFNEFGWNASPETFPPEKLKWGRVTEQQQAAYTIAAIEKARSEWNWAGVFCIWYFRQDGHMHPDRSDYYFRMVDVGFTPRLLYGAVKSKAPALRVATVGDYQESNPALVSEGSWQYIADPRASGQGLLIGRNVGDSVTIAFKGSEISLIVLKDPNSALLTATLDGRECNRLPRDEQGRSQLDLYSPTAQWQVRVPIASDLPDGEHRLRLMIAGPGGAGPGSRQPIGSGTISGIDGFSVRETPKSLWLNLGPLLAGAVAFLVAAGLLWRRGKPPAIANHRKDEGRETE